MRGVVKRHPKMFQRGPNGIRRNSSRIGSKLRNRNQWSLDKKQLNAVCHGQYYQKDWPVLTIKRSNHEYSNEETKR